MKISGVELVPNTLVFLRLKAKGDFEIYQSRIDDVTSEFVSLAIPTRGGEIIPLHVGEKLEVNFTKDDAMYLFRGVIMRRESKPIPLLYVGLPRRIIRQQRRQFVRVETFLPIWLRLVTPEEILLIKGEKEKGRPNLGIEVLPASENKEKEEKEPPLSQGIVHNISGGGMLVALQQQFKIGSFLRLRFNLDSAEQNIEVYAKVVRSYEMSSEDTSYTNSMGLEFLPVLPDIRHQLIQYAFNRQIELKKKGII